MPAEGEGRASAYPRAEQGVYERQRGRPKKITYKCWERLQETNTDGTLTGWPPNEAEAFAGLLCFHLNR